MSLRVITRRVQSELPDNLARLSVAQPSVCAFRRHLRSAAFIPLHREILQNESSTPDCERRSDLKVALLSMKTLPKSLPPVYARCGY